MKEFSTASPSNLIRTVSPSNRAVYDIAKRMQGRPRPKKPSQQRPQHSGFVTRFFIKPAKPALVQLPSGSFTIGRDGRIMISTVPGCFPPSLVQTIGDKFLE